MTEIKEIIIVNKIQTPDGTILQSKHRHDFQTHTDTISNEIYFVDGGVDYLRRSVNQVPYIELSLTSEDTIEKIREVYSWRVKEENQTRFIKLKDLGDEHIEKIIEYIKTKKEVNEDYKDILASVFTRELQYRKNITKEGN